MHQLPPGSGNLQAGTGEDVATTLRPQLRSNPESRLSEGDPYGSPVEVPVQPQTMCAGSQASLDKPFIHFVDRACQNPKLGNVLGLVVTLASCKNFKWKL